MLVNVHKVKVLQGIREYMCFVTLHTKFVIDIVLYKCLVFNLFHDFHERFSEVSIIIIS